MKRQFSRVGMVLTIAALVFQFGFVNGSNISITHADTQPVLSTNKADYAPGETATIFGTLFQSLQDVVLKIFGGSTNDGTYTETTQNVSSDANGAFTTNYTLDNVYRPLYTVVASTISGVELAQTTFRDSSIGTYDQCQNDTGIGYTTGDTGCRWTNGNLNGQNSLYQEGDSTVQRLWIDGFAPGSSHTVTLQYGTTKAGHHAYDFLTTWNASENWVTDADRCQDITGCTTTAETTFAIPHDSNGSGQFETAGRNFVIRGGTITGTTSPTLNGLYAGDSDTSITVSFTVGSSGNMCTTKSGTTTCGIAIWFGAHVAKTLEWQPFNGTTGAGTISGSPYHVALAQLDGGSVGNRDNQMAATALPSTATLTLIKTVTNDNGGGALAIAWTLSASGPTPISGVTGSASVTNAAVNSGTYTLSEGSGPTGYTGSTYSCVTNGGGAVVSNSITLAAGDNATCTVNNNDNAPSLILNKVVVNDNGGTANENAWTLSASGPTPISGSGAAGSADVVSGPTFSAGTYTLAESGSPAGYSASSWVCVGGSQNGNQITLGLGDSATCTITNNDQPGTLIVKKVVVNNGSGNLSAQDFSFKVNGGSAVSFEPDGQNDVTVNAGVYTVTEPATFGYSTSYNNCSNLVIPNGGSATCTVTNTAFDPKLTLVKMVVNDNGGDATSTDWTLSALGPTPISGASGSGAVTNAEVNAGTYSFSESGGSAGYSAGDWSCVVNGNAPVVGDSIALGAGDNAICTITNDDIAPKLTVVKVVDNGNTGNTNQASDFTLSVDGTPATQNVASAYLVGSHSVTEAGPDLPNGYVSVYSGDCDESGTVSLALADDKTCTITNTAIAPKLTLIKTVVNNNGGTKVVSDFPLFVDATGVTSGVTNVLTLGTYIASETSDAGYTASVWGTDCAADGTVILSLGDEKTCTITNDDKPGHLVVYKVTNPSSDTTTIFSITASGGTVVSPAATESIVGGGSVDYTVNAGTFSVSEAASTGWAENVSACHNITVHNGETKHCTITNTKLGSITIIKDAQPNDLTDFLFHGSTDAIGNFLLDDDADVVDVGLNGDIDQPNSKTILNLTHGNYTVTEIEPNAFWALTGVSCVATGTNTPYAVTPVIGGVTIPLTPGDNVTCIFINHKDSPTRTLGFWQTHTAYTSGVFATNLGSAMPVGTAPHKGILTTTGQLFGAFYSSIPKKTVGGNRTELDKNRMVLLQQLVAAKLNCAAFGCSTSVQTMIATADTAYAGSSTSAILASASALDAYNNSGDTIIIGNAGSATPKVSQNLADKAFWDTP